MCGKVGVENDPGALFGQPVDDFEDERLVAEVEVAFGLVEDEEFRVICERPGDGGKLKLAARDL